MAFCKFCGSQIPDGSICGCPQAQAAAGAVAPQAAPAPAPAAAPQAPQPAPAPQGYPQAPQGYPQAPQGYPQAPQGYPQAPMGYQPYPAAPAGPSPFGVAFSQFATFFKSPFGLVKDSIDGKISMAASMILGGLYALIVWLSLMTVGLVKGMGGLFVLWSFLIMIGIVGVRVGIAAILPVFGKSRGLTFNKSFTACFVTTIPSTMCWFLFGSLGLVGYVLQDFFFVAAALFAVVYYVVIITETALTKDKALVASFIVVAAYALVLGLMHYLFNNVWVVGQAAAALRSIGGLFGSLF